jgi:hypothetical protein
MAMAAAARAGLAIMNYTLLLTNEDIVVGVATDPKPQHAIRDADTQGAIRDPDSNGPKTTNPFEM